LPDVVAIILATQEAAIRKVNSLQDIILKKKPVTKKGLEEWLKV
jgi:hypothetical protein